MKRLVGEEPAFRMRGVTKRWRGATAPVLDAVDLTLRPGETLGVQGRNGAGKTTLLRLAAGILRPDAGSIELSGIDPEQRRRSYQSGIGMVSAGNGALYARLTVEDHLALWGRLAMLSRASRKAASASVLRDFELDELTGRRVDRLSTGQRQRLRLALGFMHSPTLALLDEPEASLDAEARELLRAAVRGLTSAGSCVVVCSPAGGESIPLDRTLVVGQGRLEEAP